jgi:hypothetical protein
VGRVVAGALALAGIAMAGEPEGTTALQRAVHDGDVAAARQLLAVAGGTAGSERIR